VFLVLSKCLAFFTPGLIAMSFQQIICGNQSGC
jgi:hypothetical protein